MLYTKAMTLKEKKIKVYIADDHHFVRQAMSRAIQTFTRVDEVQEASNGRELLNLVKQSLPDVVILDLNMPDIDGMAATQMISSSYPNVKILILTMYDEPSIIIRLMESGAHGYLLKNAEIEEVETAIYSIFDKDFYHNELVASVIHHRLTAKTTYSGNSYLSPREVEVLSFLCREHTAAEIADRLFISEKTVHAHRRNILKKVGAKNSIGLFVSFPKSRSIQNYKLLTLRNDEKESIYRDTDRVNSQTVRPGSNGCRSLP